MKRILIFMTILGFSLIACTPGANELSGPQHPGNYTAGFWRGLWHGFIALFSFMLSLFTDKINVYEVHNNGNWYNFGFILGVMIFFGGSGNGSSKVKRKK